MVPESSYPDATNAVWSSYELVAVLESSSGKVFDISIELSIPNYVHPLLDTQLHRIQVYLAPCCNTGFAYDEGFRTLKEFYQQLE